MTFRQLTLAGTLLAALAVVGASAETIYVAPKDSADYQSAQGKGGYSVERTFHMALAKAAELLSKPGARTVEVLVAQGEDDGKAGSGVWAVPTIANKEATLRILGGFSDGFTKRSPFSTMSILKTSAGRNGPFLTLGQRSQLKEVVISGFVMDSAPSNDYDDESNSLLKGSSRTYPLLAFGGTKTDHLVVADNVFLNGPHWGFIPTVDPLTTNATIDIQNNFFLNTVLPLQIGAGIHQMAEVRLRHNTFLLGWPYNPDPTSSNVGAVTLHHSGSAKHLIIERNLFAYNVGGAMQHDWPEGRMPKLTLRENLFYSNGLLFGETAPGAGVIAGKFGTNPTYALIDLDTLEEDFSYDVSGNVVADPGFTVKLDPAIEQDGDDVKITGYAPQMALDLPWPTNDNAKGYGPQADLAYQGER